jgi:hypothetical protein
MLLQEMLRTLKHHLNIRKYTIFISILINLHKGVFSESSVFEESVSIFLRVARTFFLCR